MSVEIENVTVRAQFDPTTGSPMVIVMFDKDGPEKALIDVWGRGMDKDQLCAVLRVIATTLEEAP